MAQTIIKVNDHGPYEISGSFEVVDVEGNAFQSDVQMTLCRCGYSSDKPFCDGTHEVIGFDSETRANKKQLLEV